MGCGMFLTARPTVLSAAFQVVMSCMPSNEPSRDPYVTTVQWSRRFLGLRLFLSLATAGWAGYARHVEHSIRLAFDLRDQLTARGWSCVNRSALAVLCVVPPRGGPAPRDIAGAVVNSGIAWISEAEFEGQQVVRVCLTNGQSTHEDISLLVDALTG
jgi:glutamate/tyrosine decarboxylase-like PLP-dependent enzyme